MVTLEREREVWRRVLAQTGAEEPQRTGRQAPRGPSVVPLVLLALWLTRH